MSRRVWQWSVVLVIVSFVLIAVHAPLLGEKLSEQQNCPLCQWLQHLSPGIEIGLAVIVEQAVCPSLPAFCCDSFQEPHHRLFAARSPPCV